MSLEQMKKRIALKGQNIRETKINNAKNLLLLDNENDPSYFSKMFFWILGDNPHKGDKINPRLYDKKFSSSFGITQKIQTTYNEKFGIGDLFYDEKDNIFWLCIEAFNMNDISWNGKLAQCNWMLKWQKPNGNILKYPCLDLNITQSNDGQSQNNMMILGSSRHIEILPADINTINIKPSQRFFISKTNSIPFIVTQNDTTTYNYDKGLCKITVVQDELNENDNIDLGICDYIEMQRNYFKNNNLFSIKDNLLAKIHYNTLRIKVGRSYSFTALFKDNNNIKFEWKFIADFDISFIKKDFNNNILILSIDNEDLIGKSFNLQLVLEDELVVDEITLNIIEIY